MTKSFSALVAVALTALTVQSVKADVIAYDGFDYTAGTQLNGTGQGAGGSGTSWGSTWSATGAAVATNTSGSLSYGTLTTAGGSVYMGNPNGTTAAANSQRILSSTLGTLATTYSGGSSGTIWLSFLYQNLGNSLSGLAGFRQANLGFFSGATAAANGTANVNGSEKFDVGSPNTYAVGANDTLSLWAGSTFSSSGIATPRGTDPANTVFILLRIDLDNTTANDTVYAWFNPSLTGMPDTSSATPFVSADLSSVNALRLSAGGGNASGTNAVFKADELRLGNTFSDVVPTGSVPEPASLALGVLGGLVFLGLRLKNKTK